MLNKQKMDDYFESFISVVIKSKAHLEVFLPQVENMSHEDKEYLRDLWDIAEGVEVILDEEEILDMDKVELEEYALKEFDVDIDRRRNLSDLIEQVIELKEEKED